jgi:hypothetical protein
VKVTTEYLGETTHKFHEIPAAQNRPFLRFISPKKNIKKRTANRPFLKTLKRRGLTYAFFAFFIFLAFFFAIFFASSARTGFI